MFFFLIIGFIGIIGSFFLVILTILGIFPAWISFPLLLLTIFLTLYLHNGRHRFKGFRY
ncbi:hypothetical protein ACERII_00655 [Evansella sp. AB-rgal1]|uniref:hypothetical protein n=1 Tax=Evansella sp. AB-rgal1 TaxID=3242696 RepID=UPI00359DE75E